MTCIFCRGSAKNASQSHILPASLGGEEWACLPDGIVCSACNQYFGDKVEKNALGSFPLILFRIFFGIPTRKGKSPSTDTYLGRLSATNPLGTIEIDPADDLVETKIQEGKSTQVRLLAEVTEPVALTRMLLKMGLETIAKNNADDALSPKFDEARIFARAPKPGMSWWALLHINHQNLFARISQGISFQSWHEDVSLSTTLVGDAEAFQLRLLDITFLVPLESRILPPSMKDLREPDYRLIRAKI